MSLIQTAEDILRDELGLDEHNYMAHERERFVDLFENYNNRDNEIEELEDELAQLKIDNDDLRDGIKD